MLNLEEKVLKSIDLQKFSKEEEGEIEEARKKVRLDPIDPLSLAQQGCSQVIDFCSLEHFSNYMQTYIADQLVMFDLNGTEIQAVQELDNLKAHTDAEN